MMKAKWLFLLILAAFVAGSAQAVAAEEKKADAQPTTEAKADTAAKAGDDDWLNTVWTQVDDMVKEEEFKLQETVTVAGVRGAEAEDSVLDKLYYKGGKRYPSQDKLTKAIETLKKALAKDPKSAAAPKQKYFVAQCYEKLGQTAEAKNYYGLVAKDHPKSPLATKAQERLTQMTAATTK
ncbi:MAG: tetratricopeptide repeat protein [Gemmatimonadetes bacterium]|jgi:tetratricopeptide (TPR) repeat protein|nr:tetratricopeptide repeat protein [Gemmatimonadota bacterium]